MCCVKATTMSIFLLILMNSVWTKGDDGGNKLNFDLLPYHQTTEQRLRPQHSAIKKKVVLMFMTNPTWISSSMYCDSCVFNYENTLD